MKDFRNVIFLLVIAVFLLQMFVLKEDSKVEEAVQKNQKPIISLSTFTLYDIAKHVAEDKFELVMILPIGVDAHSYEPEPSMMVKLEKSALVVYSGAGLEPWINGFNFKSQTLDISNSVSLRELEENEHDIHGHHDKQCVHSVIDPHYWLDVDNMIKATQIITKHFIDISPEHKEKFIKNKENYIAMLNNLNNLYKSELKQCNLNTIIVNHNAFSYLSHKYNFHVKALSGFSPEAEISPKDMIRVINEIKLNKVSTIFFESFVSDKAIKSLAQEANVDVDTLQPLGNITKAESDNNMTYEDIMKINLIKISQALVCR